MMCWLSKAQPGHTPRFETESSLYYCTLLARTPRQSPVTFTPCHGAGEENTTGQLATRFTATRRSRP